MAKTTKWFLLCLALLLISCSGGGGGNGSSNGSAVWVKIEQPATATSYAANNRLQTLGGSAFVNNRLPEFCRGLNCSGEFLGIHVPCRPCSSGVTVRWSNAATGQSGPARSFLAKRNCNFFNCIVVTVWGAELCLVPGANPITVTASGTKGAISDLIVITLPEDAATPKIPAVPVGVEAVAGPRQTSVRWAQNVITDYVKNYTVYLAEGSWAVWNAALPGARRIETSATNIVVTGLTDGVPYTIVVTASSCTNESGISDRVQVTPETHPTSLYTEYSTDVVKLGASKSYQAIVRDSVNEPIAGVVVDWTSSSPDVIATADSSSITDVNGIAVITATAKSSGTTTITVTIQGTTLSSDISITAYPVLTDVAQINATSRASCAVLSGGRAKCWGNNEQAQLGTGAKGGDRLHARGRSLPADVSVMSGTPVTVVAPSDTHTCALTDLGAVKCWGINTDGALGGGEGVDFFSSVPVDVLGLDSGVIDLGTGYGYSCALTAAGGVKCWGSNYQGKLGDGRIKDRNVPGDVVGLDAGVKAIGVGSTHACALTAAGGVKCWGSNYQGALGNPAAAVVSRVPVNVLGMSSGVNRIAVSGGFSCALKSSGIVKCWGQRVLQPTLVAGLDSDIIDIAAGSTHACALTAKGHVKCWGDNLYGQLGDGTKISRPNPEDVIDLPAEVIAVSAGYEHTCILTNRGTVKCWGRNNYGQLGNGAGLADLHPAFYPEFFEGKEITLRRAGLSVSSIPVDVLSPIP